MHAGAHDLRERARATGAASAEEAFVREGRDHGRGGHGSFHTRQIPHQVTINFEVYKYTYIYFFTWSLEKRDLASACFAMYVNERCITSRGALIYKCLYNKTTKGTPE